MKIRSNHIQTRIALSTPSAVVDPSKDPSVPAVGGKNWLDFMPPEIRNEIYELVIPSNETYSVVSFFNLRPRKPQAQHTAFLRVNKQSYTEGSPYLYLNNAFHFGNGRWGATEEVNLHALNHFFERVPPQHQVLITTVHIDIFLHKTMWGPTVDEEEQHDPPTTDLPTNGLPDIEDAQKMVSRIMSKLPKVEQVNLKWYNAWRSRKEPSSEIEMGYWEVWDGSANVLGSLAMLQTLMAYTRLNLKEMRISRRQAVSLRLVMNQLCEMYPNPESAAEKAAVDKATVREAENSAINATRPSAATASQLLTGAGKIITLHGRHCQSHEISNPVKGDVDCRFDYSEECLEDSMVMSERYWRGA